MDGACDPYKGEDSCTRVLEENPERKRPLARPRHRWKNGIKLDVKEIDGMA
jgi:hypothetical protein